MKKFLKFTGITLAAIVVIFTLLIITIRIFFFPAHGVSMTPTYNDGDIILINRFNKQFSRGDVVIFQHEGQQNGIFLKRIVGLPSEKVEIHDGRVFINGAELNENYSLGSTQAEREQNMSVTLTNDQYFVLGDNRNYSKDSRSFGPINRSNIKAKAGKVLYRASK